MTELKISSTDVRALLAKAAHERRPGESAKSSGAPAHVRKIVLYGRPASGKTCFLAALAMAREPHVLGHSCVWICDSQTIATPPGSREAWDPNDPIVARYLGKEWLQRSIDAISSGGVPRATPNDAAPFRLLFDVTQTSGRIQRLEMVDYSGELVDPNLSEDVLAKKLLTHLEEADGILVLAEAPKPGEKFYELHRELLVLQQALMLVSNKRRQLRADPLPIAMLLNKWDRYSKMNEYDADVARLEVDEFINQKPVVPQRALFSILQSVGGSLDEEAYSAIFPVSAFGKTQRVKKEVNGVEREVEAPEEITPLPSYGMEDPLVWVCQRADQLELHELRTKSSSLQSWKIWQVYSRSAIAVSDQALMLRKRLPAHLPQAQSLAKISEAAIGCFKSQCIALMLFCSVLLLSVFQAGYLAYDTATYANAFRLLREIDAGADPVVLQSQLNSSTTFLAAYSKPSWYRALSQLIVVSPSTAKTQHERLRAAMEEGNHLVAMSSEFETRIESIASAAVSSHDPSLMRQALEELNSVASPEDGRLADRVGASKERAAKRIRDEIAQVENQIATDHLTAKYNNEMRECRLPEAIAALVSGKINYPQVAASLEADFKNRWFPVLHGKIVEYARAKQWSSIDSLLRKLRDDRGMMELVGFRDMSQRIDEEKTRVNGWHAAIDYSSFRSNPHISSYREALSISGTEAQKSAVRNWEAYQEYLSSKKRWVLEITGFATSNTGGVLGNTDYRLSASYNYQRIASTTFSASKGSVNYTLDVTSQEISAKPTEELAIDFDGATTNWNFGNISFSGSLRGVAQSLTAESTVKIVTRDNYPDPTIRVKLAPVGFTPLPEPRLPIAEDPDIR